ncbi:ABC transporter substrate-binding protein [Alginatibacterium sediminis]|nr:ABC transporter substrate-binding protein [Alginatibacterium sediminis]
MFIHLRTISVSFVLLLLCACEWQGQLKKTGIVYCIDSQPAHYNPQLESINDSVAISSRHLFDRLVDIDPISIEVIPAIAKSWEELDKGRLYRFWLRDDVEFHHQSYFTPSRKLNASDVVFSFKRVLQHRHPFYAVSGGNYPFFNASRFRDNILEVREGPDGSVEFELVQADSAFLDSLGSEFAVIHSAEYAQLLLDQDQIEQIDLAPVGTGPYKFKNQRIGTVVRYQSHDQYWKSPAKLQNLVFDITPQTHIRMAKLLTGQCDVLAAPSSNQLSVLSNRDDIVVSVQNGISVSYLAFNTTRAPFDSLSNREALSHLIQTDRILDSVYRNLATAADNVLASTSWAYSPQPSVKSIRHPLNAAAIERPLVLWTLNEARDFTPQPQKLAELIANDLRLGDIELSVESYDWNTLQRKIAEDPSYDLLLIGWSSQSNDPEYFFRQQFSCAAVSKGSNFAQWCDPGFDHLLNQASSAQTFSQRIRYYHQLQAYLGKNMPVMPLAHSLRIYAYREDLQGIQMHPFGNASFKNAQRISQ